ncbi:acyl-CoA thioesterase [Pseudofrancisella aestuarii]|uniref:Acyl-CoA thioesterase n=1 Tax=Pseudofrancisella aestuarii TaxID=2670347 RepID=A0ABV9T990_9GAMM|nr:thioesterase family protein [Pseudofrancisella aestuarii]
MSKDTVYFSHSTLIEVPFFDVDSLQIVWHGHYIKYFEIARCAMLNKLEYNYIHMKNDGYAWPIVDLQLKYIKPAYFGQKIRVFCDLVEYENRLKIVYCVKDEKSNEILTKGYTIQLAVDLNTQRACFITPQNWQKKIKEICNV